MINTTSLTRSYKRITDRQKNGWTNHLTTSGNDYSMEIMAKNIVQIEEEINNSVRKDSGNLEIFSKTFDFLNYIKLDMESHEWKIPKVPESQLKCFFSDVGFYLGICHILQNVTTVWSSFFPPKIIPACHTARININPEVIEKALKYLNFEEMFPGLVTHYKPTPIETQLDAITALIDKNKACGPISELIPILKNNSKVYMPANKADEEHILMTLNKIFLKLIRLQEAPSLTISMDIIIQTILTGWILPQDAAVLFKKLIPEIKKAENAASFFQKAEILILTNRDRYQGNNNLDDSLNTNLNESLLYMSTLINQEVEKLEIREKDTPELLWNKSREEFIQTFVPLLKEKTIQQPGKKDMAPIIRFISDMFKIKKERGEGFLEAASIQSYLKEALSEHYEVMAIRGLGN